MWRRLHHMRNITGPLRINNSKSHVKSIESFNKKNTSSRDTLESIIRDLPDVPARRP